MEKGSIERGAYFRYWLRGEGLLNRELDREGAK